MVGLSLLGNKNQVFWTIGFILIILSIILIVIFARYEVKIASPIIDLEILRGRPFLAANIYQLTLGICSMGVMSFVPLYAVSIYNMSTIMSGVILTPRSIASIISTAALSIFLVKWGYRWPMILGSAGMILSSIFLGLQPPDSNILNIELNSVTMLLGIQFLIGLSLGFSIPAANNACMELMPERVATITGVRGMFRQCGGALGITVVSLILNAFNNMSLAFSVIFFGLAAILLVTFPVIFIMPASANELSPGKKQTTKSL